MSATRSQHRARDQQGMSSAFHLSVDDFFLSWIVEISDQSPYFTFVAISPQQYKWSFIVDIVDLDLKCLTRVSRFFLLLCTTACFKTSLLKSCKVRSSLVRAGYPGLTPRPPSPDIWTHISSGRLSFTPFSTLMYISAWAFSLLLMLCLAAHRLHPDLILTPPSLPKAILSCNQACFLYT